MILGSLMYQCNVRQQLSDARHIQHSHQVGFAQNVEFFVCDKIFILEDFIQNNNKVKTVPFYTIFVYFFVYYLKFHKT